MANNADGVVLIQHFDNTALYCGSEDFINASQGRQTEFCTFSGTENNNLHYDSCELCIHRYSAYLQHWAGTRVDFDVCCVLVLGSSISLQLQAV